MPDYDHWCPKCKEVIEITVDMQTMFDGGMIFECFCGEPLERLYSPTNSIWHTSTGSATKHPSAASMKPSEGDKSD